MDLGRLLRKIPGAGIFFSATTPPATIAATDLRSLLCKEPWLWDPSWNRISFHPDNTGEIFLGLEHSRFLAAKFAWEPADGLLDLVLDPSNPAILGRFRPRLRLFRGCALPDKHRYYVNDAVLTDDAFLPKTFTVTITKGCFLTSYDMLCTKGLPFTHRYALRLSFNPSPYPPPSEWIKHEHLWEYNRLWEWTEFCSRKIEEAG